MCKRICTYANTHSYAKYDVGLFCIHQLATIYVSFEWYTSLLSDIRLCCIHQFAMMYVSFEWCRLLWSDVRFFCIHLFAMMWVSFEWYTSLLSDIRFFCIHQFAMMWVSCTYTLMRRCISFACTNTHIRSLLHTSICHELYVLCIIYTYVYISLV